MTLSLDSTLHSLHCLTKTCSFIYNCICTNVRTYVTFSVTLIPVQISMSVIEVQMYVIVLLTVLILMEAMSVHARLASQEMDFSALVCILIVNRLQVDRVQYITGNEVEMIIVEKSETSTKSYEFYLKEYTA